MATSMTLARASAFKPASSRCMAPPARHSVVVRSTGWADPKATNAERAMFGENFGARDATAGEIASNFGEKVLGNWDTAHVIKVPAGLKGYIGLTAGQCQPVEQLTLLDEKELNLVKNQVPGWKVVKNAAGKEVLRHDWRLKSPEAATQLQAKLTELAQAQGHAPEIVVSGDLLSAEFTTAALGGLTMNDFVVAAKINELNVKDLLPAPRKRYWA